MGLETIAISTLAAGLLGGGAQIYQARKQEKTVKKGQKAQSAAVARAEAEEVRKTEQSALLRKKRRGATKEGGRREDILSSPLGGATVGAPTGGKTLFGA